MGNVSHNMLKTVNVILKILHVDLRRESLWKEFCDFAALQSGHNMTVRPIELTMHTDVVHTDQGRRLMPRH